MEDNVEGIIACLVASSAAGLLVLNNKKKEIKKKRLWVKKWKLRRDERGCFSLLTKELLLEDGSSFRQYLRMNDDCFEEIVSYVKSKVTKKDTIMRSAITPKEKVAIVLRFLATGETFRSLEYQSRLSESFLSNVVPEVCEAIYENLGANYMKFPVTTEEWIKIAEGFNSRWQFPHCIGALDGKHIAFRSAKSDGATYYNYKGFNSIVLLAMCKADYSFSYINVGSNGRCHDAGVLNQSDLGEFLYGDSLPDDDFIGDGRCLPYVAIGDEAFPLTKHIMRPFPYNSKEAERKIFNFRLSHARQTIEHSFGILSNRFRVLQTTIYLRPEKVKKIVQACCVLHNFLIAKNQSYLDPLIDHLPINAETPEPNIHTENPKNYSRAATEEREQFAQYFSKEGKVDWQYKYL